MPHQRPLQIAQSSTSFVPLPGTMKPYSNLVNDIRDAFTHKLTLIREEEQQTKCFHGWLYSKIQARTAFQQGAYGSLLLRWSTESLDKEIWHEIIILLENLSNK